VVTEIHVTANEITGENFRRIPVSRIIAREQDTQPRPKSSPRRPLIRRPNPTGGDAFYRQIASRYQELVAETHKPATVIAEEHDAPVPTARRWVQTARQKGFIKPARKGAAG
jgi:hypothetical protein